MRDLVDVDQLIRLTSALVAVNTTNPPGNERAAAEACREALRHHQPSWTQVEPKPGRQSLVATLPPAGKQRTLIVNGHLDVVPAVASRWSTDPFTPQVREGRLYGRGTSDMKGGIAAAVCALDLLRAAGIEPSCEIVFHLVADEERGGMLGTKALLDAGFIKGDACLIPEPTSLDVCVAERGLLQGQITICGRPGHGSRPREGISAVENAAKVVLALHAADFGDLEHPLLGQPSANVGTISGGSGLNTIAETARVGFDRRLLPGATEASSLAALVAKIDGAGLDPDASFEVEVEEYGEASEMSSTDPFATAVASAVQAATGKLPQTVGMSFTTDARFVRNQAGIPAVVCGPGDISQAHGDDEWVSIERLIDATVAYAELYRSFGVA